MGAVELPLAAEEFLTWLATEKGRSPNTLSAYRRDLRAYWTWLSERNLDLGSVEPADVEQYVATLRDAGRAPATVARATVAVRSMHSFCAAEGLSDHDPAADVEPPSVPRGLPKGLAESEVESLLGVVVGTDPVARRDRAILEVLYGTGMRISELVGLSLADVDLGDALVRVLGKGSKERVIPLGRLAREELTTWLGPGGRPALEPGGRGPRTGAVAPKRGNQWARRGDAEAVFLNQRGGRLTRQGAWGIVVEHGRRAGLEHKLTPHTLRHSCATHMLDHGADIRAVQELLGHASISTTQIYTGVSVERLFAVYREAHPRAMARSGR